MPAHGDPRRLLDDSRRLAPRVRHAKRVTWLPLPVLVWRERHFALLLFTLGYLAVVTAPAGYGWFDNRGPSISLLAPLVINGGVLLLGALGFAQAQRRGW